MRRSNHCTYAVLALVCGLIAGALAPAATGLTSPFTPQRSADLDFDGVLETLPPRTIVCDLNGDARVELLSWSGPTLVVRTGSRANEVELAESISRLEALPGSNDGRQRVRVVFASGRTRDLDASILPSTARPEAPPPSTFSDVWDSGAGTLSNVRAATAGLIDTDAAPDILTTDFIPEALPDPSVSFVVLYENDGDDSYSEIFRSLASTSPGGAFLTVATGDSDQDGFAEIVAADAGNSVQMWEATGDDAFAFRNIAISEPNAGLQMVRVLIADTDSDGLLELVFATSSSSGGGSEVFVYEQTGGVGSNTYAKVYEYSTVSSIADICVGDSDNDGSKEIILGFGGFPFSSILIRRLENTGNDTFVHKQFTTSETGLGVSPLVGDFDGDGLNELAIAGTLFGTGDGLLLYEATADDTYALTYSDMAVPGAGTPAMGMIGGSDFPALAVGGGDITGTSYMMFWQFDGAAYGRVLSSLLTTAGYCETIEFASLDGDIRPDVLMAAAGDSRIHVFEQTNDFPRTYCSGKTSSEGCIPFVSFKGFASLSSTESFALRGNDHIAGGGGILLYSFKKSSLDYHGGTLCVKAPIVRTSAKIAKTKTAVACVGPTSTGRLVFDFNARIQGGLDPMLTLGQTVFAQWQQRDSANTIGGFGDNLSNGVRFVIGP